MSSRTPRATITCGFPKFAKAKSSPPWRRWTTIFGLASFSLVRFQQRLAGRAPGPPPRSWLLTRRHRRRLILMIRALDGHLADASYREIAHALYGAEAVARYAWKTSSIRGQTIRLVQDAVRMMRGGYRKLLRGD
ncbi:MAG TPA: DUF2285 domain-containing protein [Roseiarcus sp.]|nr:DUF2285 domain-containing protein [Roseiarcus sp.]